MPDPKITEILCIDDQRALARLIDDDIYFDEHEKIHEVPTITEGLGDEQAL